MTTSQKLIKYVGIMLGLLLTISITMGIFEVISVGINIFSYDDNKTINTVWSQNNENILFLEVDINYSNLTIEDGDKFEVKTNNKKIEYKYDNNALILNEDSFLFGGNNSNEIVITIPSGIIFNSVAIDTGAGNLNIDNLNTNNLDLDLGIGTVNINNVISNKTDIDTGVGSFTINNGTLNNLDLNIGIGNVMITSRISGSSKIDSGIGKTYLNLLGTRDDYKFNVSKGIGKISIDGTKTNDDELVGMGSNYIELSGGIGEIIVEFAG